MIDPKKLSPEARDRLRLLGRIVAVPTKREPIKDHVALFRKVAKMPNEVTVKDAPGKVRILPAASAKPARKGRR